MRAWRREISMSSPSVPAPSSWRPIRNSSSTSISVPRAFPSVTRRRTGLDAGVSAAEGFPAAAGAGAWARASAVRAAAMSPVHEP